MGHHNGGSSKAVVPVRSRFNHGDVLCQRFMVLSTIFSNRRNTVCEVTDHVGRLLGAKVANEPSRRHNLHAKEISVYRTLQQSGAAPYGFPELFYAGQHKNFSVIILPRFRQDLLHFSMRRDFNTQKALKLARSMLDRLETLHRFGFVHCDVKPQNFVLNREEVVHLIDFAECQRYLDPKTGAHRPKRKGEEFCGTMMYASINAQREVTQSRKDDLESLGYSLVEMINGTLPWDPPAHGNVNVMDYIAEVKERVSLNRLCHGLPRGIYEYIKEVTALSYSETPRYAYLRALLRG